jgi:hypothetical protein
MKKKPMYRAYVVEDIDEDNSFWTLVGSAFAHEDQRGFNVFLKALPLDGRLVFRRYTEPRPDMATMVPIAKAEVKPAKS